MCQGSAPHWLLSRARDTGCQKWKTFGTADKYALYGEGDGAKAVCMDGLDLEKQVDLPLSSPLLPLPGTHI